MLYLLPISHSLLSNINQSGMYIDKSFFFFMPYTNFEVVTNEFEVKAQDHVYSPRLIKFTSI